MTEPILVDGRIKKRTEYNRICKEISSELASAIFGTYSGYRTIRETWTYEEILKELEDLIKNKSNK